MPSRASEIYLPPIMSMEDSRRSYVFRQALNKSPPPYTSAPRRARALLRGAAERRWESAIRHGKSMSSSDWSG